MYGPGTGDGVIRHRMVAASTPLTGKGGADLPGPANTRLSRRPGVVGTLYFRGNRVVMPLRAVI
jgi:hypothetical protein